MTSGQVTWWRIQRHAEESSTARMEQNAGVSGKDPSGESPASTTSAKPCSPSSSASPLRDGLTCFIGWVPQSQPEVLFGCLYFNRFFFFRSTTLKGTPGSSSILCPWSFLVPSLLWISFSVSSAGKNLTFYLSPFSSLFSTFLQRVLQREGEGSVPRRFPASAREAADGGGPAGICGLDHSGGGARGTWGSKCHPGTTQFSSLGNNDMWLIYIYI